MTEPLDRTSDLPSGRDAPAVIHLPDERPQAKQTVSGSEKRQRQHVVQFRADDAELTELRRRAWDSGRLSVGAFCRKRALGSPGVRHARGPAPLDVRLLVQHLSALNRVGNNLNQTTRALNELRLMADESGADRLAQRTEDAIAQSEAAIDEVREAINVVCRALGYDRQG
jgi:hypothetical protein